MAKSKIKNPYIDEMEEIDQLKELSVKWKIK